VLSILFVIAGLVLNVFDFYIPTNFQHPDYEKSSELGKTFQKYVTNNIIGNKVRIDILSDAIGYVLIIIGLILLIKTYKKFITPCIFAMLALGLYIYIPTLPFQYNGKVLCFSALHFTFFLVVINVLMQGLLVSRIMKCVTAMQVERKVKAMKIGCIIAMVCQPVTYLTNFLGIGYLTAFYNLVFVLSSVWYLTMMYQCRNYINNNEI
jgi:hypothetical protein